MGCQLGDRECDEEHPASEKRDVRRERAIETETDRAKIGRDREPERESHRETEQIGRDRERQKEETGRQE
jgi:hypothetical protein